MIKTSDEIIHEIEQLRYDAVMNTISGRKHFLTVLQDNPDLQILIQYASDSDKHEKIIYANLSKHMSMESDSKWAHPKDVLLATYYFVLTQSSPILARQAKVELLKLTNTFWTAYVVENADIIDPSIEDTAS